MRSAFSAQYQIVPSSQSLANRLRSCMPTVSLLLRSAGDSSPTKRKSRAKYAKSVKSTIPFCYFAPSVFMNSAFEVSVMLTMAAANLARKDNMA